MSYLSRLLPRPQPLPDMSTPQGIIFPTGGGGMGFYGVVPIAGATLPGSDVDWAQEAGDPTLNYAVHGCLRWIADNISEPALQVVRREAEGKVVPSPSHPLLDRLESPNEEYDGDSLLTATAWDYAVSGRAYWIIERDNLERPRALWWVPWWMMAPRYPQDGSTFIQDYIYRPGGYARPLLVEKRNVVHFRWGLDAATGGRLGVHRTRPVLPAIAALNEGSNYTPSILRNMGIVPNVLLVRGSVPDSARERLRQWFTSLFTRDGRGRPGVLEVEGGTGGVGDIKQLGLSPEDLALDTILNRPELAVCLAFGIHPGVLYLANAGGKGFDNGGQLQEARKASYHDCLMPMTKRFAKTLTHRLLPEFETAGPTQVFARWDFSEVEALQEDQTALFNRLNSGVAAGWVRVSEAREAAKLPVEESDQVYLRPSKATPVKTADEVVKVPESPGGSVGSPGFGDPEDDEEE